MDTLDFDFRRRELDDTIQSKTSEVTQPFWEMDDDVIQSEKSGGTQSFWGLNREEVYEKGWSARIDRHIPALLSDSRFWYFETETALEETDSNALEPTEEQPQPVVSITPTIPI